MATLEQLKAERESRKKQAAEAKKSEASAKKAEKVELPEPGDGAGVKGNATKTLPTGSTNPPKSAPKAAVSPKK